MYVDGLTHRRTIWGGGTAAHLISDTSVAELKDFASFIHMPDYWFVAMPFPHFELAPWWRRRALSAGAVDCAGRDRQATYVAAMRRFLELHPMLIPNEDLPR